MMASTYLLASTFILKSWTKTPQWWLQLTLAIASFLILNENSRLLQYKNEIIGVHACKWMMMMMMKAPSSSSFVPSLLRAKPRLSSYLFTFLAFILFATILYGHGFLFIFTPHLQTFHSNHDTQILFSTPGEFILSLSLICFFIKLKCGSINIFGFVLL